MIYLRFVTRFLLFMFSLHITVSFVSHATKPSSISAEIKNLADFTALRNILRVPNNCPTGTKWDDRTQKCHQPFLLF